MRYGSILAVSALLGCLLAGCSEQRISQIRVIEPSYSYVNQPQRQQSTDLNHALAQVTEIDRQNHPN